MTITYKDKFLDSYYNNGFDESIELYKVKLTSKSYDSDTFQSTSNSDLLKNTSPTLGYYESYGILSSDGTLQLSIEPSTSDLSVENYKTIFILYTDTLTGETDIAFQLTLDDSESLRRTVNLINIPNFNPSCSVELKQSDDTKLLESYGQGRYDNIWSEGELNSYITLKSYEAYNQFNKSIDDTDHLDTTLINEYGFKIY